MLLIKDLLDMSRIEAGKMVLDKHKYTVNEIMDSFSGVLTIIAVNHRMEVKCLFDLPAVGADKTRIGQVIINLIENAAKFSEEGSPICWSPQG